MRHRFFTPTFFAGPLALALAFAAGCSASSGAPGAASTVSSSLTRNTTPNAPMADQVQLAADNTAFAFDLYHAVSGDAPSQNLFYSPYSISIALAMTYAGAAGETATQMAKTLHFDNLGAAKVHPAFDAIDLALASRAGGNAGADAHPFRLNVSDSLWGDRAISFAKPFLDTLAVDYGSEVHVVDFTGAPDPARLAINQWVSDQTETKIPNLLPSGAITSSTRAVLVNAVYFDAGWYMPFDPTLTANATFTRLDGSTAQVPEMNDQRSLNYAEGTNYQAVEIPYSGSLTSMVVILPAAGQFASVESGLSGTFFSQVTSSFENDEVNIALPKFTIHGATISLRDSLSRLGMPDAFTESADFSAMIENDPIWLSDVLHQAFVSVTESGTVAAAATGAIARDASVAASPKNMNVNRPFFFFIRDIPTGTVLFVGRATDPTP